MQPFHPTAKNFRQTTITTFLSLMLALFVFHPTLTAQTQDARQLKLKDFKPVSIYKIPQTTVHKAKFPVIDFHTHNYARSATDVEQWLKTMDEVGIAKGIILSYATGAKFDSIADKYLRYKDRFEVWCGFDYTGIDKPGWEQKAVAELERCYRKGARGVGELGDKGLGEFYSTPTPGWGVHIDDPRLKPLLKRCGELKMPISIHVAEDEWMYLNPDSTNDGLMNAATWKVDMAKKGILSHDELLKTLENAVRDNPKTTFIACHLANSCANLEQLARLFDHYPNLYADIAARYGELAPIPRYVHQFMEKYSDRLVYGTDMGTAKEMYRLTFHILETADEHFYDRQYIDYHWPLYGLDLSSATLKKIYSENGKKILARR
jgi:predicted TIM-barrel fold metal-dependent hydrolase